MKNPCHILVLILILIFNTINAQEDCSKALLQDLIAQKVDKSSELHYLNIIDEKTYNQAKNNGGFGFEIPINGIPFGADADYNDFSEWRKEKFTKEEFTHNTNSSSNFLSKKVSENGYKSYDNCINQKAGASGLFIKVVDSDKNTITIEIFYKPGAESTFEPIKINDSYLKNGTITGIPLEKIFNLNETISPLQKISKIITRDNSNEPLYGAINAGVLTSSFKVNGYTPPIPVPVCKPEIIQLDANSYQPNSINICDNCHGYGVGIITNNSSAVQEDKAVYNVNFSCSGKYDVEIYYTSAQSRPIQVSLNNIVINSNACGNVTGGWYSQTLKWEYVGVVNAKKGTNTFQLYRNNVFPHIRFIRFIPKN